VLELEFTVCSCEAAAKHRRRLAALRTGETVLRCFAVLGDFCGQLSIVAIVANRKWAEKYWARAKLRLKKCGLAAVWALPSAFGAKKSG